MVTAVSCSWWPSSYSVAPRMSRVAAASPSSKADTPLKCRLGEDRADLEPDRGAVVLRDRPHRPSGRRPEEESGVQTLLGEEELREVAPRGRREQLYVHNEPWTPFGSDNP